MARFPFPPYGRRATALAAVLSALFFNPLHASAASQFVVISTEPASDEFSPGRVLAAGDTVQLPAGLSLTLLGEDGSVVSIPGPSWITVTADAIESTEEVSALEKNRSTLSKLAALLKGESRNADSLGASRSIKVVEGSDPARRGSDGAHGLADPWVLSVHQSAQGCVKNGPIRLGRLSDEQSIILKAVGEDGRGPPDLQWRAGESEIVLPEGFPPSGRLLSIKTPGRVVSIPLNFMPGSVDPEDPMAVIGWMVDAGCDRQALAFARLLARQPE